MGSRAINALHAKILCFHSLSGTSLINQFVDSFMHACTHFFNHSFCHSFDPSFASSLIYSFLLTLHSFSHSFFHSLVMYALICTLTKQNLFRYTKRFKTWSFSRDQAKTPTDFRQQCFHFHPSVFYISRSLLALSSNNSILGTRAVSDPGCGLPYLCDSRGADNQEHCSQHFPAKW